MKKYFFTFWTLFAFCILTIGFLSSGQTLAGDDEAVGVKIMEKEMLGNFLADGKGMTLYSFARDTKNTSNCIEGCAVNWPPFYVDPSAVIEGCEASDFSTITRSDGRQQTTYKGMPLYHFIRDQYPGDTLGQGIGEVWFIIKP